MPIVRHVLLQVPHTFRTGGMHHFLAIFSINPKSRSSCNLLTQVLQPILRIALAQIYGEHASPDTPAKRRVFGVMIEHNEVAGPRLQDSRRYIPPVQSPNS